MKFTAGKHRLQQISCIHCAVGLSSSHNGVQLVYEQDYPSIGFLYFVQNGFETFLKLAAELRTGDKAAHVKAEKLAVLKVIWNVPADDTQGKTLNNGSFSYAWLAYYNRIVLGLAGQYAYNVSYLCVTSYNRIKLVLPCKLNQVLTVLFQHVIGVLGSIACDPLIAADVL